MIRLIHKIMREANFLSLSGNILVAILGFGGFALLARNWDANEFAQWVLFISGGSLVEMLRYGITNNALVRFLSGARSSERKQLIGANALIGLMSSFLLAILLVFCYVVFGEVLSESGYQLFFRWYPILIFLNLPWNNAMVVLQADLNYGKILLIKALNSGLFFLFLLLDTFFLEITMSELVWGFLSVNAITSGLCIWMGWDGHRYLGKATLSQVKTLLNFGKYSIFTLIGTNLLRNADILIISLSPLGNTAVALYSIPLKLTELLQIPLRSFAATAFPKMSKASLEGNIKGVQKTFYSYTGALTYLFIGMSAFTFIFAEEMVYLISGSAYLEEEYAGYHIEDLVRILSIYGLLLPFDRMTGIALDSLNKPKINALKVLLMLMTNLMGDLIAVFILGSLEWVAISSIVFTMIGIWLGTHFLNKEFAISSVHVFRYGNRFYNELFQKSYGIWSTRKLIK